MDLRLTTAGMDERLTVAVGDEVRTCYGRNGVVLAISHGGMLVTVRDDWGRTSDFHPTKVWPRAD